MEIEAELVKLVRAKIGAVAAFKCALEVKRVPKTRSGTVQKIADGQDYMMPAANDDRAILTEISDALCDRNLIGE